MSKKDKKQIILKSKIEQPIITGVIGCLVFGFLAMFIGYAGVLPLLFTQDFPMVCSSILSDLSDRGSEFTSFLCNEPQDHAMLVTICSFFIGLVAGAIITAIYASKKIKANLEEDGIELYGE